MEPINEGMTPNGASIQGMESSRRFFERGKPVNILYATDGSEDALAAGEMLLNIVDKEAGY